jgi:hypothetical protein
MNEKDFDKRYKRISDDVLFVDTIEDIDENAENDWIILDYELFSKKWED